MDEALICHFYGWAPQVVNALPYSEFIKYLKAATMLQASKQMVDIQSAAFHTYKKEDRVKVMRSLKQASQRFMHKGLKDFKDVASNFAKRLAGG